MALDSGRASDSRRSPETGIGNVHASGGAGTSRRETVRARAAAASRPGRRCRPGLEGMEGRQLLSAVAEFPLPATAGVPTDKLTRAPDGNLWFSDGTPNQVSEIGRISPSGTITAFPLPTTNTPVGVQSKYPGSLTVGSDGNLWFPESGGSIGRITTSGVITEFSLPASGSPAVTSSLTAGPDGSLWFPVAPGAIGRITTSGVVTEFPLPSSESPSITSSLTVGPDGNLWFPELTATHGAIGRITTSGVITEFPLPPSQNSPGAPDGRVGRQPLVPGPGGLRDRSDHDVGGHHRVPDPQPRVHPDGADAGARRQSLVRRRLQ